MDSKTTMSLLFLSLLSWRLSEGLFGTFSGIPKQYFWPKLTRNYIKSKNKGDLFILMTTFKTFRLENEHLNNCGKFRAVRDISVAPLDASDQQQIIKMMDDPDPTSLFRKKKILKSQTGIVIDPLKIPLLSDCDSRSDRAAATLKNFHLG